MAEAVPPASREGSVVLDIGGDVGALVVHTGPGLAGCEPEVSPLGDPGHRVHSAVRSRRLNGEVHHAAVYPSLPGGCYQVWDPAGRPAAVVRIRGGQVSEVHLPDPEPATRLGAPVQGPRPLEVPR